MSTDTTTSLTTTPLTATPVLTLEQVSENLSASQRSALSSLIAGNPIKSAAQTAGVHRSTLHRWLNSDPVFIAAHNAWQQEARESAKVKLLSLTSDALAAVANAVQAGDHRIAYSLLKDLGLLAKLKPGSTDPDFLRQQIEIEQAAQKTALDAQLQKTQHPKSA